MFNKQKSLFKYNHSNKGFITRKKYNQSLKGKLNQKRYLRRLKIRILTHYGKNRHCLCCWPGCRITDDDMLSIDHIKDNGSQMRKNGEQPKSSGGFYHWLLKNKFPKGFQTLCWNHQWKKRLIMLRKLARLI